MEQGEHQLRLCYTPRFDKAVALAVHDFRREIRKGSGVPYITHLLSVTALVGEAGGDEDQLIAAMLHDWLEDIPESTPAQLEEAFGPRVRRMVVALSDTIVIPKPPWRQRKEAHIAHMRHQPVEIKLIACADKLHNARTLVRDLGIEGEAAMKPYRGGIGGTLWYFATVTDVIADGWDHWLIDELRVEVAAMHDLMGVEVGSARPPG